MTTRQLSLVVLFAAALAFAFGPARPARAEGEKPAGDVSRSEAVGAGGEHDHAAETNEDELERLLRGMSPEAVEKLIKTAVESRLKVERQQAAEEMKEDLLLDPKDIDEATRILQDKPKNTQKDNIDRIHRAFAKVDLRFGKAHKLMAAKKYAEAEKEIQKDLNVQEATYRNAGRYMLYARALAAQGKNYDAVEAYQKILVGMADRISFAAAAALDSACIYEKLQRFTYAAQMYAYAVTNYGLTLDDEALKLIEKKVEEYSVFGKNPLGWAGTMMGDVKKRLEKSDSGKETQAKEDKIVAVITDLIKTAEEQQKSSSQSQGKKRERGKKGGCKGASCPGCGECKGQGKGQGKGGKKGPPKGTQQPSSPAQISALVPGAVARPTKRSEVRHTAEVGDWASLPPRERQKLQQLRKKVMSERYRDIISKYRTKISQRRPDE